MIQAIIVDDEQHCIDRLSFLLESACSDLITVRGASRSVAEARTAIDKLKPELVFLDIQIDDQTAFDLLKEIHPINFSIIFTTAYDRYAVQAFKCSAVDYLLKPVDRDDLLQAVQKVKAKEDKETAERKIDLLVETITNLPKAAKSICIPTLNGFEFVAVADIIRCEATGNYTNIHLKNRQKLVVAKTLKEFEDMLTDYNFYRIHQSHLINLACLKSYQKGKGGYVILSDNSAVEVSTRKKNDFLQKLTAL